MVVRCERPDGSERLQAAHQSEFLPSTPTVKLDTIQMTSDVYATAMHSLLASGPALPTPEDRGT
jgi:hypothetical protein